MGVPEPSLRVYPPESTTAQTSSISSAQLPVPLRAAFPLIPTQRQSHSSHGSKEKHGAWWLCFSGHGFNFLLDRQEVTQQSLRKSSIDLGATWPTIYLNTDLTEPEQRFVLYRSSSQLKQKNCAIRDAFYIEDDFSNQKVFFTFSANVTKREIMFNYLNI